MARIILQQNWINLEHCSVDQNDHKLVCFTHWQLFFFSALNFSIHSFSYVFFTICMILFHWNSNILIKKRTNARVFFIWECKANGDLLANEFQIKSQENTKIKNNKEKEMREERKCWIHERVFNGSKWTHFS